MAPTLNPDRQSANKDRDRRVGGRRRATLVVTVAVVFALVLVGWQVRPAVAPAIPGTPTASPSAAPPTGEDLARGYLADAELVRERAALAADGAEPYRAAVDDLLRWAERAVEREPRPAERLRIKGTEGPFVDDTAAAYGLALAWHVTDDERYGVAAARIIMAWVDTTTSTADTCPDDGGCQTSLIISRTVPGFVFAADLLEGSGFLTAADFDRFRAWLGELILPTLSELTNNWGDAGTFARLAVTSYLGDRAGFDAAIDKWRTLTDLIAADGHIPAEVARGSAGIGYTQEALDYKVAAAVIAERRGVDLWAYVGAKGGSLKLAVDNLETYMTDPSSWPWSNDVRRRAASPFWELAYAKWRDPAYQAIVDERRPHGEIGHSAIRWTTLTNGIPFDEP